MISNLCLSLTSDSIITSSLTLALLPPSFTYQDTFDSIGLIWKIQDNLTCKVPFAM